MMVCNMKTESMESGNTTDFLVHCPQDVTPGAEMSDSTRVAGQVEYLFRDWDYTETPYSHFITLGTIFLLLGLIGSIGNIAVITVFLRSKHWRRRGNYLLVNLAVSDMLACSGTFPFLIFYNFNHMTMSQTLACNMYSIMAGVSGFASIGSMSAIAVDRLIGLINPHTTPNVAMRQNRSMVMIVIVWCNALLWCLLPVFGVGRYVIDGLGSSCTFDYMGTDTLNTIFVLGLFLGGFGLPFGLTIISYIKVFVIVRRHQKQILIDQQRLGIASLRANCPQSMRQDIKLAKVCLVIVSLFLVSWLPYSTVAIIGLTKYRIYLNPYVSLIPGLFAKASAVYNPFVYCATSKHFRLCVRKMLTNFSCSCHNSVPYWAEPVRHDLYIRHHGQNIPLNRIPVSQIMKKNLPSRHPRGNTSTKSSNF